jgi:hypothetical protein
VVREESLGVRGLSGASAAIVAWYVRRPDGTEAGSFEDDESTLP